MQNRSPRDDADRVTRALLEHLRRETGAAGLGFARPLRPLGGILAGNSGNLVAGFTLSGAPADWSGPLVLRVHRNAHARPNWAAEVASSRVLEALGFPAPRTFCAGDEKAGLGGPFAVIERMSGRNLLDLYATLPVLAIALGVFGLDPAFALLPFLAGSSLTAWLQRRLHRLPAEAMKKTLREADPARCEPIEGFTAMIAEATEQHPELAKGLDWARTHRPRDREPVICHGDFHPGNVTVGWRGVGLVDWEGVVLSDPELDLATTRVRLGPQIDLLGPPTRSARAVRAALRICALGLYHSHALAYRLVSRVDAERLRFHEALQLLLVLSRVAQDLGRAGESAHVLPRLEDRFEKLTGVRIRLLDRA